MTEKNQAGAMHFSQEPRRKAEFIRPANALKTKVGEGGLGGEILDRAQTLLENNTVDFLPLAEMYLNRLSVALDKIKAAQGAQEKETAIEALIYPATQLKANGGMFHYPLVTAVADKLVQFLEVIVEADADAQEIVLAFHTTIRAIVIGRIQGDGGRYGKELMDALEAACRRYFDRFPYNRCGDEGDFGTVF